jgi:hypothetical protein
MMYFELITEHAGYMENHHVSTIVPAARNQAQMSLWFCVQAALEEWASVSGPADDLALLAKSYEALPSDAHRRMFLDAALLLRRQPLQHLTALWAAQLELDDSLGGSSSVFRGSGWRTRHNIYVDDQDAMRRQRQQDACRPRAAKLLDDLVASSLVSLEVDTDSERPHRHSPARQAVVLAYQIFVPSPDC